MLQSETLSRNSTPLVLAQAHPSPSTCVNCLGIEPARTRLRRARHNGIRSELFESHLNRLLETVTRNQASVSGKSPTDDRIA